MVRGCCLWKETSSSSSRCIYCLCQSWKDSLRLLCCQVPPSINAFLGCVSPSAQVKWKHAAIAGNFYEILSATYFSTFLPSLGRRSSVGWAAHLKLTVTCCKQVPVHSYSPTRFMMVDSASLPSRDTNFQSFSQIQTKIGTVHVFWKCGMGILVMGYDYIRHYELTSFHMVFCVTPVWPSSSQGRTIKSLFCSQGRYPLDVCWCYVTFYYV